MKELKKLAGQTVIYGLGTMVPRLLNYIILTPYFTYNLFQNAQQEYGKVTELYAYIAFLMIVLTYGMETTYFRYANSGENKGRVFSTIQTSIIVSSLLFLCIVFLLTRQISDILQYKGEGIFIRLLVGILVVEAVSAIPFAKLRIENKAKKFAILKGTQIVLNITLMLLVYNVGPKVFNTNEYLLNTAGVISAKFIFVANLLASSVILVLLVTEFKDYKVRLFDFSLIKTLLLYGLPLMVSGLAGTINETLDRSIYKHVVQNSETAMRELGIYGANYKIGGIVLIFVQMFRYAAEPFFFNKATDSDSKEQYAQLMNIFTGVLLSLGLFVLLFLDYFKYFISKTYHEGLFIVPYIVLAYIFYGVLFNLSVWYKLSNRTKYAFIIMAVGAAITVVINLFFVPRYNYGASAVAHVISYGVMIIISYLLGQHYYRINYNLKRLGVYFIVAVGLFLVFEEIEINSTVIDIVIRAVVVLLFVTFVTWKEKILKLIISKK